MRKMLKILAVVLTVSLLLGTVAFAVESRMASVNLNLTFNGTTATCIGSVFEANKTISATFELYDGTTRVGYWTASGTDLAAINETCTVTRGNTCTLSVSGTINGVPFTSHSLSRDCP